MTFSQFLSYFVHPYKNIDVKLQNYKDEASEPRATCFTYFFLSKLSCLFRQCINVVLKPFHSELASDISPYFMILSSEIITFSENKLQSSEVLGHLSAMNVHPSSSHIMLVFGRSAFDTGKILLACQHQAPHR